MFDIDGTLVDSNKFDEICYLKAAEIVLGKTISSNWNDYSNTTDTGILDEVINIYKIPGDRNQIYQDFKDVFVKLISDFIFNNPNSICEIKGASRFIQKLKAHREVRIAIATGGFEESAKLKLNAAGVNTQGCAFASSSDHFSRTDIMKFSESRVNDCPTFESKTYFGDAEWDKKASELLGYRFVLVGNRFSWSDQINDFQNSKPIFSMLNL